MDTIILSPIPLEDLIQHIRSVVKQEISAQHDEHLAEKLLSPSEACKLFDPAIHPTTLARWTKEGLVQSSKFSNKVFYKYSEIIQSGQKLKRYHTKNGRI